MAQKSSGQCGGANGAPPPAAARSPALAVLAALAVASSIDAAPALQKLGLYDFFVDESSPITFNGRILMFESIVEDSPQWAGRWDPAFVNASCYYRVRDQLTGAVLVNITATINHAFGFALVQTNEAGLDTLYVFGTPWIRMQSPAPPTTSPYIVRRGVAWSGPCSENNCSLDGFYSSDPTLQTWTSVPDVVRYPGSVYNADIGRVNAAPSSPSLPPHQWVMQTEGDGGPTFWVSNASTPVDPSGWQRLDTSKFGLDTFGLPDVGSCPSIRFDPSTRLYYVLTGGSYVRLFRSPSLLRGSWEAANTTQSAVLAPDQKDCVLVPAPFGGWYTPDPVAAKHISDCESEPVGFGNDSDIDLSEVIMPGSSDVVTLVQYGSGDQKSFGFSNLALYNGGMFELLSAYFTNSSSSATPQ